MTYTKTFTNWLLLALGLMGLASCTTASPNLNSSGNGNAPASTTASDANQTKTASATADSGDRACTLVEDNASPQGQVEVRAEEVVSGLEVPWGILFLSEGDMLVTERAGQIRLVRDGQLQTQPVATVAVTDRGEGGLLGIAAHPDFTQNRLFYLYYTADQNGTPINRVEQWQLSPDGQSASPNKIILDNIPVAQFHNGGRIRFGPDGMLYIGTGDARDPQLAQNVDSLAGKILRVTPEGQVPDDNPFPGNPAFITGIRNTQGFDWFNDSILWITDHGPSGELGRTGHDEVSVARAGDNLGWPTIYGCQTQEGLIPPSLAWREALPPGGATIYTGNSIPEWQGSLIVSALGARHLHRVTFDPASPYRVQSHEVYLQGELGRLREAIMGPDGELYVTTSNCDGRGSCPPDKDKIYRITSNPG
jgi:glucose/arabinose dehydrogenase